MSPRIKNTNTPAQRPAFCLADKIVSIYPAPPYSHDPDQPDGGSARASTKIVHCLWWQESQHLGLTSTLDGLSWSKQQE